MKKPEEVFTPKGRIVNREMYIKRFELEEALKYAIRKPKHMIIHGESGTGKTWLYKKVFADENIKYEVLNAATVNSCGSVSKALDALCSRIKPKIHSAIEEKKLAEVNAVVGKGGLENVNKYEYKEQEPFLRLLQLISEKSNYKQSFLVIENIEHLLRQDNLVKELSALVLYLDDEEYSKYNIRLILVGTPNNIREYFSSVTECQTIINRIQEIPEVTALTRAQTINLAKNGFFNQLRYSIQETEYFDIDTLLFSVHWYSNNVPQYAQDICLEIALAAEQAGKSITEQVHQKSLKTWFLSSLISEHARLEKNINSMETKYARRNQVIYALAQLPFREITASELEKKVRKHFPANTKGKKLNIPFILSELSKGEHGIIRKSPNNKYYRFLTQKLKIMARWMLAIGDDERILIKKLEDTPRLF